MANRTKLDEVEALRPGGYAKSQTVLDAEQAVRDQQALRPGDYTSRWDTQLQTTLDQVQSRPDFQYDFNADPLYQMYRQQYTRLGEQAAANAAAESAALTGGFGNSYATSAAAQANQNYLNRLNGILPDLYDRAAAHYDAEGDELWRLFSAYRALDDTDYGRYRDRYGDWEDYLGYLTGRADTEYNRDYGQYGDSYNQWQDWRDYWYNDYTDQVAQDRWAAEMAEQQRQFDAQMAFEREQFEYQQAQDALAAQQAAAAAAAAAARSSGGSSRSGGGSDTPKEKKETSTQSSPLNPPWSNEVVQQAQQLKAAGLSNQQIADWLNTGDQRNAALQGADFFQKKYPWQL